MQELERAALVLDLITHLRENGSWCGETHLQKAVYFLQTMLEVPLDYDARLYKHGPFSFDLRDEITAFRAYRFVELVPQPYPYGPSLKTSPNGERLVETFKKIVDEYKGKIEWLAKALGSKGVVDLEKLGTALLVSRNEEMLGMDEDDVVAQILKLKPHITDDEARKALDEVKEMEKEVSEKCLN